MENPKTLKRPRRRWHADNENRHRPIREFIRDGDSMPQPSTPDHVQWIEENKVQGVDIINLLISTLLRKVTLDGLFQYREDGTWFLILGPISTLVLLTERSRQSFLAQLARHVRLATKKPKRRNLY